MLTFLWCVPRSVSTAFEKMIWSSGQFEVISEPFLELYKRSLVSEDDCRWVEQEISRICDSLLKQSRTRKVFVKDMGYHAEPFISDDFIRSVNNVFLIRNPRLTIPSLYKMRNGYAESETGFEGQLNLFRRIRDATGKTPLVIDGEALKMYPDKIVRSFYDHIGEEVPPNILSWPKGSRKAWADRESWHIDAINSQGFQRIRSRINLDDFPNKVKMSVDHNTRFYEEMFLYVEQK